MDLSIWIKSIILTIFFNVVNIQAVPDIDSVIAVEDDDCHTIVCNTSKTLRAYMNQNAEPCDNFFEFACGGYVKSKAIPAGAPGIYVFSEINDELQKRLRNVIETEIDYGSIRPFRLLKDYYDLCMDTDAIEKTSEDELHEILKSLGGWPVLDESWDEFKFDWKHFIYKSNKLGYPVDTFIDFRVVVDRVNRTKNIIRISQPSLSLSRGVLLRGLNEPFAQAYLNYSIAIAEILGANPETATIDLMESLLFERKLAQISLSSEELVNISKSYHLMNLQGLKSNYSSIPWTSFLNELLSPYDSLHSEDIVWVQVPSYLKQFLVLIEKTPNRVLANYAVWRMIEKLSVGFGERMQDEVQKYRKATEGAQTKEERWKSCMGKAIQDFTGKNGYFLIAAGALYVKKYFNENSKNEVAKIILNVRESFQELINEAEWMDIQTKKIASKKLHSILPIIGYPDEIRDDYKLEEHYKDMYLDTSSFLKSELALLRLEYKRNIESLRKRNKRNDWRTHGHAAITNALYMPNDNTMEITAGLLQGHLFDKDRPRYMNYGSVGWIVGHEMTHAFDTTGRQYDEEGNLKDWWGSETEKKYQNLADNIRQQYNKEWITVEIDDKLINLTINGNSTLGENIADIGGIKEAYRAYMKSETKYGTELKLPNLPYNPRQLFWISAASTQCVKAKGEIMKTVIYTDPHAPSETRVIGTFSNMLEFSKDFNCSANSRMNPKEKYSIWSDQVVKNEFMVITGKKEFLLFVLFLGFII